MIKFDQSKISFQIVLLKSITQALGGSIQVVDEEKSVGKKEVMERITVPLAVARAFIMRHKKVTKYLKPVYTALVKYEDRIIAMERHPMGAMGELVTEGLDGELIMWKPYSQINLERLVSPLLNNSKREWFFDGRYVFSFEQSMIQNVLSSGVPLTNDGKFRKLIATTIDFQELSNADKLQPQERSCLAFVTKDGDYSISPPIWKDIGSVGMSKSENDEGLGGAVARGTNISFDDLNERMSVNLNFALKAGKEIGAMFGYEYVEPLQLPRLMIELHTVNLPNIPKQVKATYDIGLQFTHAMAWLLGMARKANNLDTYIMMRSLLKYLTKRGIFRNDELDASQVFKDDQSVNDIELKNLDELMNNTEYTKMSLAMLLNQAKDATKKRSKRSTMVKQIAGLLTEI